MRTDPDAKKHKGISVIIVPMDTPGITLQPLKLMGEHDINATFFDDVRVPAKYLVGEENGGWGLITNQLNHERVTLCSSGAMERTLADVRKWAQETKLPDGRRVIDQEWVQMNLARVHARLEFLRLANWKVAWSAQHKRLDPADASTVKVFGTEFYMEAYRLLMEVLGPRAYAEGRLARIDPAISPRDGHPQLDHPDLRRRNQRAAARSHRDVRPRLPARVPLTSSRHESSNMDFAFTADQEELRALARRVFADRCTPEHLQEDRLRRRVESGVDLELWREIAELGLVGVGLPESPAAADSASSKWPSSWKKSVTFRRCRCRPFR